MEEITPTHSALLELREERRAMQEGYYFLDEKRLVLAAQIMRELARYEADKATFEKMREEAADFLKAAVMRHGLEGLQVYPVNNTIWKPVLLSERLVLGLSLHDVTLDSDTHNNDTLDIDRQEKNTPDELISTACNPSPEAEHCRTLFSKLVIEAAILAGITRNLQRLRLEYQKTAKRARALEDILLPEIDTSLKAIEASLEELDREEVTRVHR